MVSRIEFALVAGALTTWLAACGTQAPCDCEDPEAQVGTGDGDGSFPAERLPDVVVEGLTLIPPGPGGHAVFTDVITVEPGDDITLCTFTDVVTDDVSYIHDTLGHQSHYGHHAILYYLPKPEEPGTRDCGDMEKFRQIIGGTGGDDNSGFTLPGNVVSEVPAGSQLVINHHWINYGEQPQEVQAMMVTVPPESEDDLLIARAMVVTGLGFELSPGATTEHVAECELEQDVPVIAVLGHEHEWGTWVSAEHVRAGGDSEMVFDHAYTPEMAANPTVFQYPIDDPLMLATGDRLRLTCEWQNDTPDTITFPREMCVLFAFTLAPDDMNCVNGRWL